MRPYRSTYTAIDLGKKVTPQYHRTDAQLPNDRDQLLQYSYYKNKTSVSTTCLIYCHCNSGSRVESIISLIIGIPFVKEYIARGWNVCLFDFSGSGLSGGDYISLGHYEARDL